MSALSNAFTQFFTALSVLFTAFESICKTMLNLATVAEESSGTYMDQARVERISRLAALNATNGTQVQLPAPNTTTP